ncbi:MAG: hypothetical protein QM496_18560 [Verrucomicrobiota bacterium]
MLEGLEATEIRLYDLERTKRIDAEFFKKSHVLIEKNLASRKTFSIADLVAVSDGNHFSISDSFIESGIPYYRGQDVTGPFFIEQSNPIEITSEAFADNHMKRSHLEKGDVLLSIVGTVGALSLVGSDRKATCSCKLAIFRPHSIEAEFLAIYLESKLGASQIQRFRRGTVQTGFLLEDVDQVLIPQLSTELKREIVGKVQAARIALECSEQARDKAEQTLLSALKLDNWEPPNPLSYEKPASDVFAAKRYDANFFHPKFEALENKIAQAGELEILGNLSSQISRGRQPDYTEKGLPVVNSKHVAKGTVRIDDGNRFAQPRDNSLLIEKGNVLINGTGVGTIGRSAAYLEPYPALPDNHVTIIKIKEHSIDPTYLATFLNSPAGQLQVEQRYSGSSGQIELYPSDIADFKIWLAPEHIQNKIRDLVFESRNKSHHSKSLLARAKRAVEIAIEQDEKTALAYLDGKHYVAGELLPKLFGLSRHYIDLATIQKTIEAEALHYESATIKRYLQDWMREGLIHDAGRGWYSDLPEAFLPDQNIAVMQSLQKSLKQDFPLLDHTLWSTRELAAYFHHLPTRHATFLMVDRDAFEPVADSLRDAGHRVVIHPLGEAAKSFSLETEDTIILRPRLSSDHVEKRSPIEHTLIDLYYEIQKLGLYELEEYRRLLHNLTSAKRINLTAFKRYAERRKIDVKELLPSII